MWVEEEQFPTPMLELESPDAEPFHADVTYNNWNMQPKEAAASSLTKLEELAFLSIYRSVIDCLLKIRVHRNKRSLITSEDEMAVRSPSDKDWKEGHEGSIQRQSLRNYLTCKLANDEERSKETRSRLLKYYSQEKELNKDLRFSCFLDVVLDGTVAEISAIFDPTEDEEGYDGDILPTIVKRCSGVKALHLYGSDGLTPTWVTALSKATSQLHALTILNLYKVPSQCSTAISSLGISCPLLKSLRISFTTHMLSARELLSIFYSGDLDSFEALVPFPLGPSEPWKAYHRYQVSSLLLYPFCQTLEEVRINRLDGDEPFVIGFLLRHLVKLRQLETSDFEFRDYSSSIRALWDIWNAAIPSETVMCLEHHPLVPTGSTSLQVLNAHRGLIVAAHFSGQLTLSNLFLEGEKDLLTLKSICDICPHLTKLELLEVSAVRTDARAQDNPTPSSVQLEDFDCFKRLNQLRAFTCTESDGPLCAAIAHATAPFLTHLEMALDDAFVPQFDFLINCTNLQVLKLSTDYHPPLKSYFKCAVCPEEFLPKLEEVQLEFCMNAELEELFLKKSTLKHVDVLCLHHLGQTEEQFMNLFLQWPNLVSFKYKMPGKFTVDMCIKMLGYLPHLRSLFLYKDIKYRCSSDFHLLKRICRQREVTLELHLFVDTYLCIDGDISDEFVSSSDDSDDH